MARWAVKLCTEATKDEKGKGQEAVAVSMFGKSAVPTWKCVQRLQTLEVTLSK